MIQSNECYHNPVSMQECLFMTLAYQKTMQLSQRDGWPYHVPARWCEPPWRLHRLTFHLSNEICVCGDPQTTRC